MPPGRYAPAYEPTPPQVVYDEYGNPIDPYGPPAAQGGQIQRQASQTSGYVPAPPPSGPPPNQGYTVQREASPNAGPTVYTPDASLPPPPRDVPDFWAAQSRPQLFALLEYGRTGQRQAADAPATYLANIVPDPSKPRPRSRGPIAPYALEDYLRGLFGSSLGTRSQSPPALRGGG